MIADEVTEWLLDSDPAIRWQVMRDVLDAPQPEWRAQRARVETEGWGAGLLERQDADGQWAGASFFPHGFTRALFEAEGQPWTTTSHTLTTLHELGLDPSCERATTTVALVGANCRWDAGGELFWSGETEECINGRTVADGAYFGADVSGIVKRLLGEIQPDGGWNCERSNGSSRSSYHSTINVLEGLLEFERAHGAPPETQQARRGGEEFLLERNLFRRLSTGEAADGDFLELTHPNRWLYDILRGLDYFRSADRRDPRLAEPIEILRGRQLGDGRWPLDRTPRGRTWFPIDGGVGEPSRWITLRALRILLWWEAA